VESRRLDVIIEAHAATPIKLLIVLTLAVFLGVSRCPAVRDIAGVLLEIIPAIHHLALSLRPVHHCPMRQVICPASRPAKTR
jgi:hypothetical protein